MNKTRVLVIDDSALVRGVLKELIDAQPDLEVVGAAPDAYTARELIKQLNPDVLTLDVEMPGMNGLDFLERLMRLRPMPVVMVSSLTARGSEAALKALELGAVDYIAKPRAENGGGLAEAGRDIAERLRQAARARIRRHADASPAAPQPLAGHFGQGNGKVVFLGSSTGGTEALKEVLTRLPADAPPVLMTQHMPETFTPSFAQRLNNLSAMTVKEAAHNERLLPGHAYLAPGHSHLRVRAGGGQYFAELDRSEPVNRHRPSVDVLFDSAARVVGSNAVGVILTGMGKDGARGLLAMRQAGAWTIAQDETSCVVYGMPKAAVDLGAAREICPLKDVARRILDHLARRP